MFLPRRFLSGVHRQTLASFFLSRHIVLPSAERRLIEVEPGIKVLAHCHWQSERQNALTVIIVHGLEGSSDSHYMIGIASRGLALGMNVVRMNQRNCGGTDDLAPTLYHSGRSQDVAAVAQNLIQQDQISGFALVGFSMGGNLVLKLAGEWANAGPAQFRAVAAVCPAVHTATVGRSPVACQIAIRSGVSTQRPGGDAPAAAVPPFLSSSFERFFVGMGNNPGTPPVIPAKSPSPSITAGVKTFTSAVSASSASTNASLAE